MKASIDTLKLNHKFKAIWNWFFDPEEGEMKAQIIFLQREPNLWILDLANYLTVSSIQNSHSARSFWL